MKLQTAFTIIVVLSLLLVGTIPASALTGAVNRNTYIEAPAQTFTINSTGDLGDVIPGNGICETSTLGECTLRAAMMESNANPGADTIHFNIPGAGPHTISPSYGFDFISDPVTIDATTQPGFAGTPIVELDGSNAGAGTGGLTILAGSSTVQGLVINRFDGYGMRLDTNGNNLIQGNFIGTDATGTVNLGNSSFGILIVNGSSGNTVGGTSADTRNIVSGNGDWGVTIVDPGTTGNFIQGNFIGTDVSGRFALPNGGGVGIFTSANGNQIGGTAAGAGNIVSGNRGNGIVIGGNGTNSNTVQGNFIGTDVTGTVDLGNFYDGVQITSGAAYNTIGGPTDGARNIISGNDSSGLGIYDTATQNIVQGNFIGTDVSGTLDLGNSMDGVGIDSNDNLIGGTAANARNVISGNDRGGVTIFGANANENVIQGNYIGTDVNGSVSLTNFSGGVVIGVGASRNMIGGTAAGAGNLLSGNGDLGVLINDTGTEHNVVQGNLIGTDASGSASIPNNNGGMRIGNGASNNSVGPGNVISGNTADGIVIVDAGTSGNTVQGNYIGTDGSGTGLLSNAGKGIAIFTGATNNLIGGTSSQARNIISGNSEIGVVIYGEGASSNTVQGNYIGTDVSGTLALGNTFDGVTIGAGASDNLIGGTTTQARNLIAGNGSNGIGIYDAGTTQNIVQGNFIGTNVNGTLALGNSSDGVSICCGAAANVIGGTVAGAGNLISGNHGGGIGIYVSATANIVQGNFIGTDITGTVDLGNGVNGIAITGGSGGNLIGGTTVGTGNLISGNADTGIIIVDPGSAGNVIQGNLIGTDVTGSVGLGNNAGVSIGDGASDNMIGGTEATARNIISGNVCPGIAINSVGSTRNLVEANYIGTDKTGTQALGNGCEGIYIGNGATDNSVGGITIGAGNLISGNIGNGVTIDIGASGNLLQGNYIGTDVTGILPLGNTDDGVVVVASNNIIGGTTSAARNVISGNQEQGIRLQGSEATGNVVQGNFIGTDVTGMVALGNGTDCCHSGVVLHLGASNNTIGGNVPGAGNVISGNTADGVTIMDAGTTGNVVAGNFIGTDLTGTKSLANSFNGIDIFDGASDNIIGGTTSGAGNTIAFNNDNGVILAMSSGTRNGILSNSIYSNGSLGIDLGQDGVTLNDLFDADSGPNNLQNFPVITAAKSKDRTVQGTLFSNGKTTFRLEFFSSNSCDPSGYGEGQTFLGATLVTTTPGGIMQFKITLPTSLTKGAFITATATDPANNTSEFSQCVKVAP